MADMTELEMLLEQVDELLGEPLIDGEDALELAAVAGLAARLGAPAEALADAVAWRDSEDGQELITQGFEELELGELVEWIDNLMGSEEDEVEEALSDFDDLVAAAVWCGRSGQVAQAAREVEASIQSVPDPFAPLAWLAEQMIALEAVGTRRDLYGYWFAVADAAQWADGDGEDDDADRD